MRTFIAIELSKEIKDFLSFLQDKLKDSRADVKWVSPENIHLTLKFLGEIDDKKLDKIIQIAEDITKDKKTFYLRLSSIGVFPNINFPRVIWAGVDKGDAETKEIVKVLEEKIAKIGIPPESRAFSSHITIGRVRSSLNRKELIKSLDYLQSNFGQENLALHKSLADQSADSCGRLELRVTKITVFKSTLTPKGPIYEVLKEASLRTN